RAQAGRGRRKKSRVGLVPRVHHRSGGANTRVGVNVRLSQEGGAIVQGDGFEQRWVNTLSVQVFECHNRSFEATVFVDKLTYGSAEGEASVPSVGIASLEGCLDLIDATEVFVAQLTEDVLGREQDVVFASF